MTARLVRFGLPAFLLLGLLLGGSSQGAWGRLLVELGGVALLGITLASERDRPLEGSDRLILALLGGIGVLAIIQLLPLPPGLWSALPGRAPVAHGFDLLGQPRPWLPVSLAPTATWSALLTLVPAIALLAAVLWLPDVRRGGLGLVVVGGAVANMLFGALQVSSGGPTGKSPWYLYADTNFGLATGFFANANHLAILLVVAIPFLAALSTRLSKGKRNQQTAGLLGLAGGALLLLLLGIALSGSMAAAALSVPALIGSAVLVFQPSRTTRIALLGAALAVGAIAIGVMLSGHVPAGLRSTTKTISFTTRADFAAHSGRLIPEYLPVGTGLGTFPDVYPTSENPETITRDFVNHAHDDYLEIALETGVVGILLVLLFLAWWGWRALAIWRSTASSTLARAATLGSGVLLLHSIVDFPLRTIALQMVFALCVAFMAMPLTRPRKTGEGDARHLKIG